jgi:hypothetical protein
MIILHTSILKGADQNAVQGVIEAALEDEAQTVVLFGAGSEWHWLVSNLRGRGVRVVAVPPKDKDGDDLEKQRRMAKAQIGPSENMFESLIFNQAEVVATRREKDSSLSYDYVAVVERDVFVVIRSAARLTHQRIKDAQLQWAESMLRQLNWELDLARCRLHLVTAAALFFSAVDPADAAAAANSAGSASVAVAAASSSSSSSSPYSSTLSLSPSGGSGGGGGGDDGVDDSDRLRDRRALEQQLFRPFGGFYSCVAPERTYMFDPSCRTPKLGLPIRRLGVPATTGGWISWPLTLAADSSTRHPTWQPLQLLRPDSRAWPASRPSSVSLANAHSRPTIVSNARVPGATPLTATDRFQAANLVPR